MWRKNGSGRFREGLSGKRSGLEDGARRSFSTVWKRVRSGVV